MVTQVNQPRVNQPIATVSNDSGGLVAKMNMWLHRQVMQKLAQNGGRVSADLQG